MRHVAVLEPRQADVAHVNIPESIEILQVGNENSGLFSPQNVIDVGLLKNIVGHNSEQSATAERFVFHSDFPRWYGFGQLLFAKGLNWSGNSGRYNGSSIGRIFLKTVISNLREATVSITHSIRSNEDFPDDPSFQGGRFSEINHHNVGPHFLIGFNTDSWSDVVVPHVRSLIDLKLLRVIGDAFPGQTSLPASDSGVDDDSQKREPFQPHFMGFTAKVYLAFGFVCGSILFAFGTASLFFIWGKIGIYSPPHMNVMFAFWLLFSAGFIWLGQWVLFSVFGLTP